MSGEVSVRYFAAARERAGCSTESAPVCDTLQALLSVLVQRHPALAALLPHLRYAVNEEFCATDTPLKAGDEVALIPPVAGGAGRFTVVDRPLQLAEVVEAVQAPGQGGVVTFTGAVRDATGGRAVLRLEYEAYAPMAIKRLEAIGAEAARRWPGCLLAISHRVGVLQPAELAVVIAASAPHRAEAFEACRYAIEALKADVPIWKKEVFADGEVWVGLGP